MKTRRGFAPAMVGVMLVGSVTSLQAQATQEQQSMQLDVYARNATRAQLEALVAPLQARAEATKNSDEREELRIDLAWLSYRIREGDIWEGDVISLAVAGETDWTSTFTVSPARTLILDGIDPLPLNNVLYSELEAHVTAHIARYIREPRVQADALKRIAVLGSVGNPGFLSVSGSTVVADLITQAGGPSSSAELDKAEFKRLGKRIGFDTGGPIAFQAYSLDQLGIRSGDELHIPAQPSGGGNIWQDLRFIVIGITAMTVAVTRIF